MVRTVSASSGTITVFGGKEAGAPNQVTLLVESEEREAGY
jgi:hypothetical protein